MAGEYVVLERGKTNGDWRQVGAADSRRKAEVLARRLRPHVSGKLATPMVALAER